MKKYLFLFCALLSIHTGFAQMDTTVRPLAHQIILKRFFLQTTDQKIAILSELMQTIPDQDSGKIAVQYDGLRSDIAQDYLKANNRTAAEGWLGKMHTGEGRCSANVTAASFLLKEDAQGNWAYVKARLQPLVDSANRLFLANASAKEACNFLMPVYVHALLVQGQQDKQIVYYLQPLYKANGGGFPSDMRNRVSTKPEDYKLTDNLSYDLAMALAATGHTKDAIDILARLYLTGDESTGTVRANIAAECKKIPGGEAYFTHITDSVQQYYKAKLAAMAANKKDINGKPLDFNALKGKYILLDFWGSWCGPCRASHPHLKELYAKYKDKGFEIVGISYEHSPTLEADRAAWTKAVEQDSLTWIQVLNNENIEGFNAVTSYAIAAFPTKILLDRNGNIIGRYVGNGAGSMALTYKLQEVLGK